MYLKSRKKARLDGPKSQLKLIEPKLPHYMFELRKLGIKVDNMLVLFKVLLLSADFCGKLVKAQHCVI
jgi:hypothetical protein